MYRDQYTNFTFDDLESSNFKVWITNKNDLKRNMSPNFSDKFNTPTYGQVRYHEGTTIDKQDFKLSCVAVDVTLSEWRAITEWLSPLKSGKLTFDWNDKYYYMVKVSKAISGTMFNRYRIDSVVGQSYIITFDIEFTTVSDWAATGPYCELSNYELPNVSIFNNSYCIPQIIIRDKVRGEKVDDYIQAQTTFYGGGYIDVYYNPSGAGQTTPEGIKVFDIMDVQELQNSSLVTVARIRYQQENNSYQCIYYYLDASGQLSWSFPVEKVIKDSEAWYRIYINDNQCLVRQQACPIKYKQFNNNNLLFSNPSAYDAYPTLYFNGAVSVQEDNKTIMSYEINDGAYSNASTMVALDNKKMTLTSGGKSIVGVVDSFGAPVFQFIKHTKQMVVPSGRPELLKAVFNGVVHNETPSGLKYTTFTFLMAQKPIYSRHQAFLFHLFKQDFSDNVNIFNKDSYNSKMYYTPLYDVDYSQAQLQDIYTFSDSRFLLNTPDIAVNRVTDPNVCQGREMWEMKVTFFTNAPDSLGLTIKVENPDDRFTTVPLTMGYAENPSEIVLAAGAEFEPNEIVYLSLCDYTSYSIDYAGEKEFSVGIQTRDVI